MLTLLFEPEINDAPRCFGGIAIFLGVVGNKRSRPASIPKLKLLDRRPESANEFWSESERKVPFGFGAVAAISQEMSDPFGSIYRFHTTTYFVLQSMTTVRGRTFTCLANNAVKLSRKAGEFDMLCHE